jgi:hypothetical protein
MTREVMRSHDVRGNGRLELSIQAERRYRFGERELSFFSITAIFGTAMDVTVDELAIESFYPADEATATALRERS